MNQNEIDEFLNRKCERCNYNEFATALQQHHKDRNKNDNSKENIMILCANCHFGLHTNQWRLEDIGIKTPELKIMKKIKKGRYRKHFDYDKYIELIKECKPMWLIAKELKMSVGTLKRKLKERNDTK